MTVDVVWTAEVYPDFVSRCVMGFQKKPYSHVALVIDGVIYHAVGKGVSSESFEHFLNNDEKPHKLIAKKTIEIPWSKEEFEIFWKTEEEKEYSQSQLFFIASGLKLFKNGAQKRICSEFVGLFLELATSIDIPGDCDFWTPATIEQILQPEFL